jgi:hypothetical protein
MVRRGVHFHGEPLRVDGEGGVDDYDDEDDNNNEREDVGQGDEHKMQEEDLEGGEDDEQQDDIADDMYPGDDTEPSENGRGPFSHAAADRRRAGGRWTAPNARQPTSSLFAGSRSPVGKLASLDLAQDGLPGEGRLVRGLPAHLSAAGATASAPMTLGLGSGLGAGIGSGAGGASPQAAQPNTDVSLCLSAGADQSPLARDPAAVPHAYYSEPPRRWRDAVGDDFCDPAENQSLGQLASDAPSAPRGRCVWRETAGSYVDKCVLL